MLKSNTLTLQLFVQWNKHQAYTSFHTFEYNEWKNVLILSPELDVITNVEKFRTSRYNNISTFWEKVAKRITLTSKIMC